MTRKLSTRDLESYASLLRRMLASVRGDIDSLEQEALGDGAADAGATNQGDEGAGYSLDTSLELLERDEATEREIEDALARIGAGDYGRCEGCESWIPRQRLRTVPHARNCIDCQRKEEGNR